MIDKIIEKYDFVHPSDGTDSDLHNECCDLKGVLHEGVNIEVLKKTVNILMSKICNKDFIQNVTTEKDGCRIACNAVAWIRHVIEKCTDEGTLSIPECQDCLFDFLLTMLRLGPTTAFADVIDELIAGAADMNDLMENLNGKKLTQLVAALKEHKYIPGDTKEYKSRMTDFLKGFLKRFMKGRDDYKELEIWTAFLDLYTFYLEHTKDLPETLHVLMQYCTNVVRDCYKGNNPYEGYPDGDVLKQHLQRISALVLSPDFPKGKKQLEMATDHLKKLCNINEEEYKEQSAALKPDLLRLFKQLAASNKGQELASLIEPLLNLHNTVQEAANDEREKAMEELAFKSFGEWTTQYLELLENFKQSGMEDEYAPTLITETREDFQPKESDVQYWFKITKAMWAIPTYKMQKGVSRILDNNNLKLMWKWKQNIHEAIEMIDIVDKLNLPTEGDEWDDRNIVDQCGSAVYNLIKMLQVLKIDHMIMAEVGRMTINKMKLRSLLSYNMIGKYSGEIDFEKCSDVCPELMKKLEELILDPVYPWHEYRFTSNAVTFFTAIWYALRSKEDIPTEYSQSMIKVFLFCMDDGCNLLSPLDGSYTLHGQLLTGYMSYFIQTHCSAGLGNVCLPLLKVCLKYRHKDEDKLKEMTIAVFESASQYCPSICIKFLQPLLDWYIEEHLERLVGVFANIVEDPGSHDCFSNVMDKFMDVCKDQSDTYYRQLAMFTKIAAENPNMFTMKAIDIIMKYHYKDKALKTQILYGIMDNITKKNPKLFAHHMNTLMADKSLPAMEQNYINTVLLNVTKSIQKYKEPVFKYLMTSLKETNDITAIHVTLNSLRQFAGVHGLDLLRSQKEYFRKRREKEKDVDVKGGFTVIIDQIEGRSLEKVDQNIKETQEGVDKLDQRVTGTEKVVGDLTTRVDEHDENIQELGEGLDTVTQRVDFAEKDIEETKIKVEEIDMKTMTNAPRWSRDLTKIMNPQTEHDWRLLAQRLGYSNDDIRAWASQHDPCMAVLSEWYATHKTREANYAVLTALQEISRMDGAAIVENAMKAVVDVVEEEEVDYSYPPPVFLSYQWGHQDEVKLIRNHLQMAGYECWMDIGQMGGGDKLFEKIDSGIRGAKVIICCVSEKYAQSPNCNREVNLSVSLGKPMIPLLMEKMGWPPKGSMGPIFSEYLFVRFFQRVGEETDDQRIWPVAKFKEMLMQLNCYGILPEESLIDTMYKNWWIPVQEVIVIDKTKKKRTQPEAKQKEAKNEEKKSPEVFISYQWGKQKEIMAMYQRLTSLGLHCWMDIHQMGGGDSLYEKIDSGVRGCKVVLTIITQKYSLSANCRREVSLADALKKPIIPLLLEKMDWPPSGPMSMVFTQLLFINFYRDEEVQMRWTGPKFDELMDKIGEYCPMVTMGEETNPKVIHKGQKTGNGNHRAIPNKKKEENPVYERPISVKSGQRHMAQSGSKQSNSKGTVSNEPSTKIVNQRPPSVKSAQGRKPSQRTGNQKPEQTTMSQKNTRGAGSPHSLETMPSPVRKSKPTNINHTENQAATESENTEKNIKDNIVAETNPRTTETKTTESAQSSSCLIL